MALAKTKRTADIIDTSIDEAIKAAFVGLDRDIMELGAEAAAGSTLLADAISQMVPAYSGSCALLSYYHSKSRQLKVACVGDSRAILGRRNASGGWDAIPLSIDQTGKNPLEVARLKEEHPGEPDMVKDGRILGMAVSRAFGDSRWKWSRQTQDSAYERFYGPNILEHLRTPPYLTAEPVISTTEIRPDQEDFLIMASDGLWDCLTNEQAVDLVGRWLKKHDPSEEINPPNLAAAPTPLPNHGTNIHKSSDRTIAYSETPSANEKHFVVKDENAATHLARNALGGGDEDRLCGMLTPQPPYSRNIRYGEHEQHSNLMG